MSKLELRIMADRDEPYVQFFVDGRNLAELIREVDRSSSAESMDDVLPMGYQGPGRGFSALDYGIEDTVLGHVARSSGRSRAFLFACGCGCASCSSVTADVLVKNGGMTIANVTFHNNSVSKAPPFTFDCEQVAEEVRRLEEQLKVWTRPPPKPPKPPILLPKSPRE